jgi:hypothetical protein
MSFTGGMPDSEHDRLDELAESTPEEFENLEAEKQLTRERWHRRLARILRVRSHDD